MIHGHKKIFNDYDSMEIFNIMVTIPLISNHKFVKL